MRGVAGLLHPAQLFVGAQLVDGHFRSAAVGLHLNDSVFDAARDDGALFSVVLEEQRFSDLCFQVLRDQRVRAGRLIEQRLQRLFFQKTVGAAFDGLARRREVAVRERRGQLFGEGVRNAGG